MRSKREILEDFITSLNLNQRDSVSTDLTYRGKPRVQFYQLVLEILADNRDAQIRQAIALEKMESKYYENDIKPLKEVKTNDK